MADGIILKMKAVGAKAVQNDLKHVGGSAAKMGKSFSVANAGIKASNAALEALSLALAAAPAAMAAGFAFAIKQQVNLADELGKTSQRIGVSVEALGELGHAAGLSGSNSEDLNVALRGLGKTMYEAAINPASEVAKVFDRLGVEVKNTDGTMRDTEEVFKDISDQFAGMEDGAAKSAIAMRLMEEGGARLIPMLNSGSDGLEQMAEEARALGLVFSQEDAVAAAEFNDALSKLGSTFTGFVRTAASAYLPMLLDIAEGANLAAREVLGLGDAQRRQQKNTEEAQDALNDFFDKTTQYKIVSERLAAAQEAGNTLTIEQKRETLALASSLGVLTNHSGSAAAALHFAATAQNDFSDSADSFVESAFAQFAAQEQSVTEVNNAIEKRIGKGKEFIKEIGAEAGLLRKRAQASAAVVESQANATKATAKGTKAVRDNTAALKGQVEAIEGSLMTQEQQLAASLRKRQEQLNQAEEQGLLSAERNAELQIALVKQTDARLAELTQQRVEKELAANEALQGQLDADAARDAARQEKFQQDQVMAAHALLGSTASFAGSISQMVTATMGAESEEAKKAAKVMFGIQQAAALADAGISMAVAIGKANAAAPPPLNIPGIVAATAIGAAQIAAITAASISGVADAGLPPGALRSAGLNQHTVLAVRNDEMVLDPVGTAAISRMLEQRSGPGGQPIMVNASVEIDGEVLGRSVDNHLVRSSERGLGYQRRIRY